MFIAILVASTSLRAVSIYMLVLEIYIEKTANDAQQHNANNIMPTIMPTIVMPTMIMPAIIMPTTIMPTIMPMMPTILPTTIILTIMHNTLMPTTYCQQ